MRYIWGPVLTTKAIKAKGKKQKAKVEGKRQEAEGVVVGVCMNI